MKKKKELIESMNSNDILRKRRQKIAIIAISILLFVLLISSLFAVIMKNNGSDSDDDRSTLDILLNRNNGKEKNDEFDDVNGIKPVLDKDGNVIKTAEEVAYEYNKNVIDGTQQFADLPGQEEANKKDATITESNKMLNEVKLLVNDYKFVTAESNINTFFKTYKRTSKDENVQKILNELSIYQLDANLLSNLGISYESIPHVPHKNNIIASEDLLVNMMDGIQNPLMFLYGHIELPIEYQQDNTLDTRYSLYLTAHVRIEDLIKIKEVKELTKEELGRDASYFISYKTAYKIDFIYDKTPVLATIVQQDNGSFKMVKMVLKERGANNQFYTLADFKLMDENLENGKSMFDGIDMSVITDYVTGNEINEEYLDADYDIKSYGGGI